MVTTTTVYSFQKPAVAGDEDAWGGYLNNNIVKYESILTGNTTITMTNAFDSTTSYNTVGADDYYGLCNVAENTGKTSSVFNVYNYNNSFALVDTNNISATVHGDLA